MAPDDELDDLLSSLDPDEFEERPRTELLTPPAAFGEEVSDVLPAIRTPLPPAPIDPSPEPDMPIKAEPAMPAMPAAAPPTTAPPVVEPPAKPPRAAPPMTLDPQEPLQGLEGVMVRPPDQPKPVLPSLSTADDLDAAFALAEAESMGGHAELQAAADAAAELDPIVPRDTEPEPISDPELGPALAPSPQARRGLPTIVWVAIISFAVAALGGILFSQIDAFHPERQVTRDQLSEGDKERALEAHRRAQPVPGNISITSPEPDTAVWLLLGRTPLQSITLPSDQVHEVRFELPGRETLDATVDRTHWTGTQASLSVELRKGASTAAAYPPEQSVKPPPGPKGRGELLLASQPAGARAWLLIGFTPDVKLSRIETGRRYEFRLAKDGFLPGYAVVEESDWSAGRTEANRSVALAPAKTARK